MECPLGGKRSEVLLAYSAGNLDAAEVPLLECHLESCPGCRDFVRAQRAVWDALEVWEPAPVSADFDRRLHERIDRQVSWFDRLMRPLQPFWLGRTVPVAAGAAVVLMAVLLVQRTPQVDVPQPEQVVAALDEMDALSQLSAPVRSDSGESKM